MPTCVICLEDEWADTGEVITCVICTQAYHGECVRLIGLGFGGGSNGTISGLGVGQVAAMERLDGVNGGLQVSMLLVQTVGPGVGARRVLGRRGPRVFISLLFPWVRTCAGGRSW